MKETNEEIGHGWENAGWKRERCNSYTKRIPLSVMEKIKENAKRNRCSRLKFLHAAVSFCRVIRKGRGKP